jgi:hypothetical protein
MEQVNVKSWEEFENRLQELRTACPRPDDLLFRGQSNACWRLRTTLERRIEENLLGREYYLFCKYYDTVQEIKPQVETFVEHEWNKLNFGSMARATGKYDDLDKKLSTEPLPGYEYLIYLRHHSFPSPLLDWTGSPYVASYFAFTDPCPAARAIYVYSERPHQIKIGSLDKPAIHRYGPNVRSHKRHFFQQSQYTICTTRVACSGPAGPLGATYDWYFASHEDVFKRNEQKQDILTKFVIPDDERIKVLKKLQQYNLNSLSLFGSEEGLLESLAMRHFDFKSDKKPRPDCEPADAAR